MASPLRIPFNRATFVGREFELLEQVQRGGELAGNGEITHRVEALLSEALGNLEVLVTTSCTSALEVAALSMGLTPGDEVIVPSFTFVSTASSFTAHGATPIFADIRPDTLNIDEKQLASLVSDTTKAIVVTHYAGVACEMDAIMAFARERDILVVEDNAHGLFGRYHDQPLGAIADFGALSFHATKNFSSGQGGALVVRHPDSAELARIARENGTNRPAFDRGEVSKYTWVGQGINAVASELVAAVILAQLEEREAVQRRRRELWHRYNTQLAPWATTHGVDLPTVPTWCTSSFHLFHLVLPNEESRSRFIAKLAEKGILAVSHYVPLHDSPMGQALGGRVGSCPVSEDRARRLVRLPLFFELTDREQDDVIDTVLDFHEFS